MPIDTLTRIREVPGTNLDHRLSILMCLHGLLQSLAGECWDSAQHEAITVYCHIIPCSFRSSSVISHSKLYNSCSWYGIVNNRITFHVSTALSFYSLWLLIICVSDPRFQPLSLFSLYYACVRAQLWIGLHFCVQNLLLNIMAEWPVLLLCNHGTSNSVQCLEVSYHD
jgi:hypothetical protein